MSLQEFVSPPRFEEYREAFKDFFRMERREDGVLLVAAHTLGGPIQLSVQNHRSLGQMLKVVGADPENEVLILTGSGEEFMMGSDPEGFALEAQAIGQSIFAAAAERIAARTPDPARARCGIEQEIRGDDDTQTPKREEVISRGR